ncbi:hypothetical protein DID80_06895 [Candidatus Marinamargulisbacteria bacterium SCGC AAA071-K20]|nr:hypothetical protein DID80_06895 [Candidatus Marinamargulisbacteria bacterium SCGC AAA071-K20]
MSFKKIIGGVLILLLSCTVISASPIKVIIKISNQVRGKTFSNSSLFSNNSITQINEFSLDFKTNSVNQSLVNQDTTFLIDLKDDTQLDTFIEEAKHFENVIYVEPVYPVSVFSGTNDPFYNKQYYLSKDKLQHIVDLEPIHEIIVAVLDTGVDVRHLDLEESIYINENDPINGIDDDGNGLIDDYNGANFLGKSEGLGITSSLDLHGHGTHISGIIAAQSNNAEGITGLNSKAKILNVRFLNQFGRGNQVDAAAAIVYATNAGAKVINCSWGYFQANTILEDAINYALSKDVIIIAAIGNTNTNLKEYPAAFEGVISIGSVGEENKRSSFSSFGDHLDFQLCGESIYSPILNDKYGYKSGTSQSAAIMTGMVSKFLSINPLLNQTIIFDAFVVSSSLKDQKSYKEGYGTIDIQKLVPLLTGQELQLLENEITESKTFTLNRVMNYPNPVPSSGTTFGFETDTIDLTYTLRVFNLLGGLETKFQGRTVNGYNKVEWTPSRLFSGTYLYLLDVSSQTKSKTKRGKLSIL